MDAPPPIEPADPVPEPPNPKATASKVGAGVVGVGLVIAKFALIFGKVLALSWTFLLSLWLYVIVFGWSFAVVVLLTLVIHEFGHYFAFRSYGIKAHLPQFVPFLGAFTMGAPSGDIEHDAYIALAGPLTGLALASLCYAIGQAFHAPFWTAAAAFGGFLNLFNLLPFSPFDGGRAALAVWHAPTPTRIRVGASYLGTAVALFYVMRQAHGH